MDDMKQATSEYAAEVLKATPAEIEQAEKMAKEIAVMAGEKFGGGSLALTLALLKVGEFGAFVLRTALVNLMIEEIMSSLPPCDDPTCEACTRRRENAKAAEKAFAVAH